MICIINGDADKAYQTAEELRRTVERADNVVLFDREPVNIKVTVSMGLYQIDPAVGMQFTKENARAMFDAELKNADDLVYAAKNSGRNRIKTTADMYDSYLVSKSAEVIGVNEIAEQAMTEIRNCVAVGDSDSIIEAAESVGADEKDSRDLRTDFNNRGYSIHELDNGKIGNVSYMDIKPKYRAFINNVYESQVKRILPLLEEQGIKYSGVRNSSGNYTLTVNKYDVKKVKSMIFENSQEQYISQDQKKEPKFYNKEAFKDIDNKTYIQTDSKTAYEISQEAQKDGVVFSAKFDGEKSAVTVDGQKDLNFINKIKSIKEWAEKVHVRAAPIKQRQLEEEQRKSRGGDAR